jgi:predicted  nucleic acid-binding Zn-ribbon protein
MDPAMQVLLQYGAVGVMALAAALISRVLWKRLERDRAAMEEDHDREIARLVSDRDAVAARADRLEAELSRLNGALQNGYVDTIVQASTAITEANRAIADARAAVRRS